LHDANSLAGTLTNGCGPFLPFESGEPPVLEGCDLVPWRSGGCRPSVVRSVGYDGSGQDARGRGALLRPRRLHPRARLSGLAAALRTVAGQGEVLRRDVVVADLEDRLTSVGPPIRLSQMH